MSNPLDNAQLIPSKVNNISIGSLQQVFMQARQNPQAFEEDMRRNNPEAYSKACQMRDSMTPRNAVLQLAKSRGINPNIFKMLGI